MNSFGELLNTTSKNHLINKKEENLDKINQESSFFEVVHQNKLKSLKK